MGCYRNNKSKKSIFNNVVFEHGSDAFINDIHFYGSLSIIESEVEITNSLFINLNGEDGVYVKKGNSLIQKNTFKDNYNDCLDLDGGEGDISHNSFNSCGDEAIDLSNNKNLNVIGNVIIDSVSNIDADSNLEKINSKNYIS